MLYFLGKLEPGGELRGQISDFTSLHFKMVGGVDHRTAGDVSKLIAAEGALDVIFWNIGLWARGTSPPYRPTYYVCSWYFVNLPLCLRGGSIH